MSERRGGEVRPIMENPLSLLPLAALLLASSGFEDLHEDAGGDSPDLVELFAYDGEAVYELVEATEDKPLPKGVIGILTYDIIQEGDKLNKNGRIYPWELLRDTVKAHAPDVSSKNSKAFDGHPNFQDPPPSKTAGFLAKVGINEQQKVIGPAEFHLLETAAGKDLLAIARAGVPIGVSSRMRGRTKRGKHAGLEGAIVQPGLVARGWDFVTNPSVARATKPSLREEHTDPESSEDTMEIKTIEDLREHYPALVQLFENTVRSEAMEAALTDEDIVRKIADRLAEDESHQTRMRGLLLEDLSAELERQLEEKEDAIRAELQESMSPDLQTAQDKIQTLEEENEELTNKVNDLESQVEQHEQNESEAVSGLRGELKELKDTMQEQKATADAKEARAYVFESTDGNPLADRMRLIVLGRKTDENPYGVEVEENEQNKSMLDEFKDVVAPKDLAEAKSTLARVKAIASSTSSSATTRVGTSIDESTKNNPAPGSKGVSRLTQLSGNRRK